MKVGEYGIVRTHKVIKFLWWTFRFTKYYQGVVVRISKTEDLHSRTNYLMIDVAGRYFKKVIYLADVKGYCKLMDKAE